MRLSKTGYGGVKLNNIDEMYPGQSILMQTGQLVQYGAGIFGYNTIPLLVKRNIEKFPEDFYFQLTIEECQLYSRFQNETLKNKRGNNIKYLPYAFTQEGVAMLASVLKTDIAVQMSVNIMRAFVKMRKYISTNLIEQKYINNQVLKNTEDIKLLQESFNKLNEKQKVNEIYFNGQIFDAYSKILEISLKVLRII